MSDKSFLHITNVIDSVIELIPDEFKDKNAVITKIKQIKQESSDVPVTQQKQYWKRFLTILDFQLPNPDICDWSKSILILIKKVGKCYKY